MSNHEFNTFPAVVDLNYLQPSLCISACSAIGASLAAIENASMCFCKYSTVITSVNSSDINCKSVICAGNPKFFCGSFNHLLVYKVIPKNKVKF